MGVARRLAAPLAAPARPDRRCTSARSTPRCTAAGTLLAEAAARVDDGRADGPAGAALALRVRQVVRRRGRGGARPRRARAGAGTAGHRGGARRPGRRPAALPAPGARRARPGGARTSPARRHPEDAAGDRRLRPTRRRERRGRPGPGTTPGEQSRCGLLTGRPGVAAGRRGPSRRREPGCRRRCRAPRGGRLAGRRRGGHGRRGLPPRLPDHRPRRRSRPGDAGRPRRAVGTLGTGRHGAPPRAARRRPRGTARTSWCERLVDLVGDDGDRHTLLAPLARGRPPRPRGGGPRRAPGRPPHRRACCWSTPIWLWHWRARRRCRGSGPCASSSTAGERRAQGAPPSPPTPARCGRCRTHPRDERGADAGMLAHFGGADEIFLAAEPGAAADTLERLHRERGRPVAGRRQLVRAPQAAVTLAALPPPALSDRALEVGCSVGALAAGARRGAATSWSPSTRAPRAVGPRPGSGWPASTGATVERTPACPRSWPGRAVRPRRGLRGRLLPQPRPSSTATIAARRADPAPAARSSLCHWRHPVRGWPLDGAAVHRRLREAWGRPTVRHLERDFVLEVWQGAAP